MRQKNQGQVTLGGGNLTLCFQHTRFCSCGLYLSTSPAPGQPPIELVHAGKASITTGSGIRHHTQIHQAVLQGLTVGTVMECSHKSLSIWFWTAYLVASQTPKISAVQFQWQLGLSRYETAFGILHHLRAGMVRPDQDRIGCKPGEHVEIDETWVGGRNRGEGRGVHHKVLVACAVKARHRNTRTAQVTRKDGRYAGRARLAVVPDQSASSLCGLVENTVTPGPLTVTDHWSGYAGLGRRGYEHFAVAECGDPEAAEDYLPIIHLVFGNLKTWLIGIHHGVSHHHLQACLNEFTFCFNRHVYPFNEFHYLLGIAGDVSAPTFEELYIREMGAPHML